jgi:phosphatidylserine decarboxylase
MDAPASRAKIAPFLATYGVDVSEFADAPDSFRTFNEFFYRKLKPQARPIAAGDNEIAFPADGRHLVLPDIAACGDFFIKGVRFDLAALLGDAETAKRYAQRQPCSSPACARWIIIASISRAPALPVEPC